MTSPTLTPRLEPIDVQTPEPDDVRFWSVTTILKVLRAEGLIYWAANETAHAAVSDRSIWVPMLEKKGPAETEKWLAGARFRKAEGEDLTAADKGTEFHRVAEEYALTGVRPDCHPEAVPFLLQFEEWCQRFQPTYLAAETTVYNETLGYAGTLDGVLEVDGVRFLIDYKTTRKSYDSKGNETSPYPEVALQLAAYGWAEKAAVWRPRRTEQFRRRYYLLGPTERDLAVPVPEWDAGLCLHITAEHCNAHPVRIDEEVFLAFQYVLEAFHWDQETSKDVIGPPLAAQGDR